MSERAPLLAPGGPLATALEGYEDRPGQRKLAEAVEDALSGQRALLAEAGTGTGKTLAYLAPAAQSEKRVVISTGTRTLQDQLAHVDLPALERALGRRVRAVTLKGVSNYLCARRYRRAQTRALAAGGGRTPALERVTAWAAQTETGDRAEVGDIADDDPVWETVTTDAEGRLGPRCPHFESCFVTHARRRADDAELVFVNHHLFFADLALQGEHPGAKVLPRYDAVIFDEAHKLEEVLTEHFGAGLSSGTAFRLARDLREHLGEKGAVMDRGAGFAEDLAQRLELAADALWKALRGRLLPAGGRPAGRVPCPPATFEGEIAGAVSALEDALGAIENYASQRAEPAPSPEAGEGQGGGADEEAEMAASLARRAARQRSALLLIAEQPDEGYAYWADLRGERVALGASPIDVREILRDRLFPVTPAVVLTSATLSTGGDFRYTRERLGLEEDVADAVAVESPFAFSSQALLYVPRAIPEPAEPAFSEACAREIASLAAITEGRGLALFTSHRALAEVSAHLRAHSPVPIYVQGEFSRSQILARFRADPEALICATGSFWEGIDLPGDTLSLVVIDKLPFSPPTDPMAAARIRALERRGVDPFRAYQLPRAALALKQGFGRLIRRRRDRGIAAVLDRRLLTRSYGRHFLGALPPDLPRTSQLEPLRRWWEDHEG